MRRINLWLLLAVVCFLGIIAVFFIDGYMGLYYRVRVETPVNTFEIPPEFWEESGKAIPSYYFSDVSRNDLIRFQLVVENRRFTDSQIDLDISLWEGGREIQKLLTRSDNIAAFEPSQPYEWEIDTSQLDVLDEVSGTSYIIKINGNGVERRLIFRLYTSQVLPRGFAAPLAPVK